MNETTRASDTAYKIAPSYKYTIKRPGHNLTSFEQLHEESKHNYTYNNIQYV